MIHRLAAGTSIALLAACAQAPAPDAPPAADDAPIAFYTAGAGEVMVVADRCTPNRCPDPDAPRFSQLVYNGMRNAERAVFTLTEFDARPDVPLQPSHVAHFFVPDRPETPPGEGNFIAERPEGATIDPNVTEVVVNPVAGVAFGNDELEITIASATPARVVYTVEPSE